MSKGVIKSANKKRFLKTEENFEPINRWWEKENQEDTNVQWSYMEHHGLMFFPPYIPHGLKVIYEGKPVALPAEAEEVANFWCGVLDSDYATKKTFIDNFWSAFVATLPVDHPVRIGNKFQNCDFSLIKDHLDREKLRKKEMTKPQKEEIKRQKLEAEAPYAHALVDWIREKVGCNKVEPSGLFRGRGEHPKQGQLKKRIIPEDVTLNLAEDAPIPRIDDLPGHCWSDVICDNTITWMSYFKDTINDQYKYMYLSAQSKFKGLNDFMKYEKARKLKDYVDRIRQDYKTRMNSEDTVDKQLGTATYLIDFLALRVGGEKDTEEEADTVGCCSLRVEHMKLNDETNEITLDFLGKDSIRYLNTVKIDQQAFNNMKNFNKGKSAEAGVFDKISCLSLNNYLKELMPGLSAKVFRTYNASITLDRELDKLDESFDASNVNELCQFYNNANREVAILCNHQRSVPKQHEASMDKLQKQLSLLNEDCRELKDYLKFLKSKSEKFNFKSIVQDLDGNPRKSVIKDGMKEDNAQAKLTLLQTRRDNMDMRIRMKDDNKTVALGTSKINYMDPRITVSFCKKYDVPIEKVFNKSLRMKFPWAMYVRKDYRF